MATLQEHAKAELQRAGLFDKDSDYNGMLGDAVMDLVKCFAEQGHSGYSASMTIHIFSKVAAYETLTPLENPSVTGEYVAHGVDVWQSTRDGALFSANQGRTWYHLDKYRKPWQRVLAWLNWRLPEWCPTIPARFIRGRVF